MFNQLKTIALLGILSVLLIGIGSLWGTTGIIFAGIIALVMNVGSYYFSDKFILNMYKAKELSSDHHISLMVKRLSKQANIPMPKVYIIPQYTPNAFATGRNPQHSAVAFTQGIIDMLDVKELEGVAAHELAHIKNRDTLIATIAATIVSIISIGAEMLMWSFFFGRGDRDNTAAAIASIIAAPLFATIIQLAISRSREYLADSTAAKITGQPISLAKALEKLQHANTLRPIKHQSTSTASLFIVNPLKSLGGLFSTHPPITKRINKLHNMSI